jgi:hypothetical protein
MTEDGFTSSGRQPFKEDWDTMDRKKVSDFYWEE